MEDYFFLFVYVFLLYIKKQTSINKSVKNNKKENISFESENVSDETVIEEENLHGQEKENLASCAVSSI